MCEDCLDSGRPFPLHLIEEALNNNVGGLFVDEEAMKEQKTTQSIAQFDQAQTTTINNARLAAIYYLELTKQGIPVEHAKEITQTMVAAIQAKGKSG